MCADWAALRHNEGEDADVSRPLSGPHRLLPEDLLPGGLPWLLQGYQSCPDCQYCGKLGALHVLWLLPAGGPQSGRTGQAGKTEVSQDTSTWIFI